MNVRAQKKRPGDLPTSPRRRRWDRRRRDLAAKAVAWFVGWFARIAIFVIRLIGRRWASALAVWITRLVAPFVPENKVAAANIAAAFPEKSEEERRRIRRGVWDNLARTAIEYAFLKDIRAEFRVHRMDEGPLTATGLEDFLRLREDGKPGLIFSAHLANWELPATVAERFWLDMAILYHVPKNSIVAADLMKLRNEMMGNLIPTRFGSAFEISDIVARGGHVALMVDQRRARSPLVPFFGRFAQTSTLLATLARQYDCPVHGVRAIRLPDNRFHIELTPHVDLPRDEDGRIDVMAATGKINDIVEGWIRQHPEQWLWLHDRWRLPFARR